MCCFAQLAGERSHIRKKMLSSTSTRTFAKSPRGTKPRASYQLCGLGCNDFSEDTLSRTEAISIDRPITKASEASLYMKE